MPAWRAYSRSTPRRYDLGAKHDPRCMHPGISLSLYIMYSHQMLCKLSWDVAQRYWNLLQMVCIGSPNFECLSAGGRCWLIRSVPAIAVSESRGRTAAEWNSLDILAISTWGSPELFKSELELESNFYPIIIQTSSRSTSPWIWISWCTTEASKDHCRRPSEISDPSKSSFKILG